MYVIFERKTDMFKLVKYDLKDFKEVLSYLRKIHSIENGDEETRIIYYETQEELEELARNTQ